MAEVQSEGMDTQASMAKYVPVVAPVVLVAVGYKVHVDRRKTAT